MDFDWTILVIILQLIFLEGVLSIDNAAVLGALVIPLPRDKPIEWPKPLKRLGEKLHPMLGNQRSAALRVGLLGAYLGQSIMLVLASFIISNPWLKLVGAAYLIRLAIDSLSASAHEEEDTTRPIKTSNFWTTVLTVELMDLAFSLDNVVAAVSISNKLWVVMLGVALAILMMRFAAGVFSFLIEREPILKTAAYVLVLNIGVELLLEELANVELSDWMKFGISIGTILIILAYSRLKFLHGFLRPILIWIAQGLSIINQAVDWVLAPLKGILILIWRGLKMLFRSLSQSPH